MRARRRAADDWRPNCIQASHGRDDALEHELDPAAAGLAAERCRERTTRVSLNTRRSPRTSSSGQGSRSARSTEPCPVDVQQAASRTLGRGTCAISSLGRSKSKSEGGRACGCHRAARSKMSAAFEAARPFSAIMPASPRAGNAVLRARAFGTAGADSMQAAGRDGGIGRRAGLKIQFWQQSGVRFPSRHQNMSAGHAAEGA